MCVYPTTKMQEKDTLTPSRTTHPHHIHTFSLLRTHTLTHTPHTHMRTHPKGRLRHPARAVGHDRPPLRPLPPRHSKPRQLPGPRAGERQGLTRGHLIWARVQARVDVCVCVCIECAGPVSACRSGLRHSRPPPFPLCDPPPNTHTHMCTHSRFEFNRAANPYYKPGPFSLRLREIRYVGR